MENIRATERGASMRTRFSTTGAAAILLVWLSGTSADAQTCSAARINYTMFLSSKPQDAAGCAMEVRDGQIRIAPPTTNPSMSCPDMFGWKMYAEVVKLEFWKSWASDPDTWPADPLPL